MEKKPITALLVYHTHDRVFSGAMEITDNDSICKHLSELFGFEFTHKNNHLYCDYFENEDFIIVDIDLTPKGICEVIHECIVAILEDYHADNCKCFTFENTIKELNLKHDNFDYCQEFFQ